MNIFDRRDRVGLTANVSAAILSALVVNGLISVVNPAEMHSPGAVRLQPPGYVIGLIWVVLFAALGAARWAVIGSPRGTIRAARLLIYLLLFCLAYPVYTLGLTSQVLGIAGNAFTIVMAGYVAIRVSPISRLAAGLVFLVVIWVSFASFLVVEQLRSQTK